MTRSRRAVSLVLIVHMLGCFSSQHAYVPVGVEGDACLASCPPGRDELFACVARCPRITPETGACPAMASRCFDEDHFEAGKTVLAVVGAAAVVTLACFGAVLFALRDTH